MIVPDEKSAYTVRQIILKDEILAKSKIYPLFLTATENSILLEEIVNTNVQIRDTVHEPLYAMVDFRELIPNINKEVEEILNRELVEIYDLRKR